MGSNSYATASSGLNFILGYTWAQPAAQIGTMLADFTYNSSSQVTNTAGDEAYGYGNLPEDNVVDIGDGYDEAGRLGSVTVAGPQMPSSEASYDQENYSYDEDNREVANDSGGYVYQADGQLQSVSSGQNYGFNSAGDAAGDTIGPNNEVLFDGTYHYTYDASGNRLTQTGTGVTIHYTWDDLNRLTQVAETTPAGTETISYAYDFENRRISETVAAGGTSGTTRFVYDGSNVILTLNGATGALQEAYLPDPNGGSAPLAQSDTGGDVYWLITDREDSVTALLGGSTSSSPAVAGQVSYDAFGNPTSSGVTSIFGFQGMIQDMATAPTGSGLTPLDYDNARWYSSQSGDFLSQDPSGYASGGTNLYEIAANRSLGCCKAMARG